jgi:hypothetical protein
MRKQIPAGLLALAIFAAVPDRLRAGDCSQPEGFYLANHYVVKDIKLEAPLDIFHFLTSAVQLDQLPLKAQRVVDGAVVEKGEFDNVAFATSQTVIRDRMMARMGPNFRFEFVFILPALRACDDSARTLEAVYRVYAFSVPAALTTSFNSQQPAPTQHASSAHPGGFLQAVSPQLRGGYDINRHFYSGGKAAYHGASGTPFNTVTLDGTGSAASLVFQGQAAGSRNWKQGPVEQADWVIGYLASDLPSNAFQVQESKFTGRFSLSSRALFNQALVLYVGGAVEAGNQHSNGAISSEPTTLLRSQIGNLKVYAGTAWAKGPNSLEASYGIQAGKATPGAHVDYSKHLVHVADSLHLLPKDHHPLSIDFELGAGWIRGTGPVPLAEEFFGGNLNRVFIPGDAWSIPDGPFIRSFPTNSLNLSSSNQAVPGALGGRNFFSVNTTIAYAVWGQPLVPQSILGEVEPLLHGQLNSFETALKDVYTADLPDFKAMENNLSSRRPDLADLRAKLTALKQRPGVSADIAGQADNTLSDLDDLDDSMAALGDRNAAVDPLQPVLSMVMGFPQVPPQLTAVADDLQALGGLLEAAGMTAEQADFRARETMLRDLQANSLARFKSLNQSAAIAKAKADMQFPTSVLDQLLHAINIYSISPALLLDAARIGPQPGLGQTGVRYGVGPAVRLSLLNFDVTLGYSFNPRRLAGERRGAPVITLELSDIFR